MNLFGTRQVQRPLPNQQKVCPVCLSVTEHTVTESGAYLMLYFIPLFPIKRDVIFTCSRCGESYTVPYAEYQAGHAAADGEEHNHSTAEKRAGGKTPKSTRDKAKVILEGRVVNGRVENLRAPFNLTSRHLVLALWVAFGLLALLTIILLVVIFSAMSR